MRSLKSSILAYISIILLDLSISYADSTDYSRLFKTLRADFERFGYFQTVKLEGSITLGESGTLKVDPLSCLPKDVRIKTEMNVLNLMHPNSFSSAREVSDAINKVEEQFRGTMQPLAELYKSYEGVEQFIIRLVMQNVGTCFSSEIKRLKAVRTKLLKKYGEQTPNGQLTFLQINSIKKLINVHEDAFDGFNKDAFFIAIKRSPYRSDLEEVLNKRFTKVHASLVRLKELDSKVSDLLKNNRFRASSSLQGNDDSGTMACIESFITELNKLYFQEVMLSAKLLEYGIQDEQDLINRCRKVQGICEAIIKSPWSVRVIADLKQGKEQNRQDSNVGVSSSTFVVSENKVAQKSSDASSTSFEPQEGKSNA